MSENNSKSKRIFKNTIFLYIRMIFLLFVTLFTSRVLLDKLGFVDYGIYNIVGGVAAMFVFFSSSLVNATQRFLNVELGKNDLNRANIIFNQHLLLYIFIAVIVVVLSETLGVWFVRNELVLPIERIEAAVYVFRFTMYSLALSLVGIAFDAEIIAHEDMNVYSYIGLFEGFSKLLIVYMISITTFDRLVVYAFLIFAVTIITQLSYVCYSLRSYKECYFRRVNDLNVIKETFSLVGWNFVGTAVYAINDSGINILLNMFFGPIVNAARAISYQVNAAVNNFSTNFFVSVRPQIVKSYAIGDFDYLMTLFLGSSKYSFFLLWLICFPLIMNTDYILYLWQGDVPQYTAVFTKLILIYSLINVLNNPVWSVALAVGKLRKYICWGSGVFLMTFPMAYVALKLNIEPYCVFLIMCAVRVIYLWVVLCIIKEYIPFTFYAYWRQVIYPILKVVAATSFFSLFFPVSVGVVHLFVSLFLQLLLVLLFIYMFGLNSGERTMVISFVKRKMSYRELNK